MSIAASYLRNKIAGQANAGSPQENPCVAQLAGAATQQQTLVSDVDDVASHISEPVALTVAFLRDEVRCDTLPQLTFACPLLQLTHTDPDRLTARPPAACYVMCDGCIPAVHARVQNASCL